MSAQQGDRSKVNREPANHRTSVEAEGGSLDRLEHVPGTERDRRRLHAIVETGLLVLIFFTYAGDLPPMVNESHYLVKAKNYWQPQWCGSDLLASSAKAHATFYATIGWLTQVVSLETTAWIGRLVGWTLIAFGLQSLCWNLFHRRYLSLAVALVWIAGTKYGNLAGEWVIGGIEAKVIAYGFVLLGLAELVRRRWNTVWMLFGTAAAFHVLTGGWSVVAATVAWWLTERRREDRHPFFTPGLLLGGLIAMLGLWPAIALSGGTSGEDSIQAARIYTYYRISHHLLPANFATSWFIRHGVLVAVTLGLAWRYRNEPGIARLGAFALGAVIIAVIGLLIGALPSWDPDLAARLLRYYWFRLTDAIVPLMLGVVTARMLIEPRQRWARAAALAVSVAALLVAIAAYQSSRLQVPPSVSNDLLGFDAGASPERQQQVYRDWMAVCRWAKLSSQPDELFLTPRHQQTFKWYAERGEVVNWKDVPQDTESLLKWYRRFQEIYPQRLGHIRVTIQYSKLREYRRRYGVRWMIVDRRVCGDSLPLVRRYPTETETNETFAVYELPQ